MTCEFSSLRLKRILTCFACQGQATADTATPIPVRDDHAEQGACIMALLLHPEMTPGSGSSHAWRIYVPHPSTRLRSSRQWHHTNQNQGHAYVDMIPINPKARQPGYPANTTRRQSRNGRLHEETALTLPNDTWLYAKQDLHGALRCLDTSSHTTTPGIGTPIIGDSYASGTVNTLIAYA